MNDFYDDLIHFKENVEILIKLSKENAKKYKDIILYENAQLTLEQILGSIAATQSLKLNKGTGSETTKDILKDEKSKSCETPESEAFKNVEQNSENSKNNEYSGSESTKDVGSKNNESWDVGPKDEGPDFKKVLPRKKSKRAQDNFKTHDIIIKQGMDLSYIKDRYDEVNENIIKNTTNEEIINNLRFYFKDIDYFDKRGGLYEYKKGEDTYYICENKFLYKLDTTNNLIKGEFYGKKQIWKEYIE